MADLSAFLDAWLGSLPDERCAYGEDRAGIYQAWLESLTEDELVDHRFSLYDRIELVEPESDTAAELTAELSLVYQLEKRCQLRRILRDACRVARPDTNATVFADAFCTLAGAQGRLGTDDAVEVFRGALEVAEQRGSITTDEGKA